MDELEHGDAEKCFEKIYISLPSECGNFLVTMHGVSANEVEAVVHFVQSMGTKAEVSKEAPVLILAILGPDAAGARGKLGGEELEIPVMETGDLSDPRKSVAE